MSNIEPEKKIIAGLNHQSHLTESASVLEPEKCKHKVVAKYCFRCKRPDLAGPVPEKKDVWGERIRDLIEVKPVPGGCTVNCEKVVDLVFTHFISRAEVVEWAKEKAMPKDAGWEDSQKTIKLSDLLDLLTQ